MPSLSPPRPARVSGACNRSWTARGGSRGRRHIPPAPARPKPCMHETESPHRKGAAGLHQEKKGLSSGIGLPGSSLVQVVGGVAYPRPEPAGRPHCRPSGGGRGSVSTVRRQERSRRTGSDKLGIGTSFLWVCPCASPSRGQESRRPGALRPYSTCAERRPVALRPMLSHGLPLSGVESYNSTLNNIL
jgi:hypothetical protein